MPPKLDNEAEKHVQDALQFNATNPEEKGVTASRIFNINPTLPHATEPNCDSPLDMEATITYS